MSLKFVDTNIFLEILVRKGEKSDRCRELFKRENNLWTNELVISEVEWVLRDGLKETRERIVKAVEKILALEKLRIDNRKLLLRALEIYRKSNIDWVDCLNAQFVLDRQVAEVYSYDRHFDKFSGIKRLEP